jgi:hypothetical protein
MTARLASFALCAALAGCSAGTGRGPGSDPDPDPMGGDAGPQGTPMPEACNGLDDDLDGSLDEGCSCAEGATQSCWPGSAFSRGRGICADGQQACEPGEEFGAWGACQGAVLPAEEIAGNCIDENCDGDMPGCTSACSEFEVCDNAADDDCDGLVDCDDEGCDCPTDCTRNPELCTCEERCVAGTERFCDEPEFCAWGLQDCGPDGRWGACIETDRIPADCESEFPDIGFPVPTTYDPGCCVEAGLCCQNYGHDPSLSIDASIGACAGIVETVCQPL